MIVLLVVIVVVAGFVIAVLVIKLRRAQQLQPPTIHITPDGDPTYVDIQDDLTTQCTDVSQNLSIDSGCYLSGNNGQQTFGDVSVGLQTFGDDRDRFSPTGCRNHSVITSSSNGQPSLPSSPVAPIAEYDNAHQAHSPTAASHSASALTSQYISFSPHREVDVSPQPMNAESSTAIVGTQNNEALGSVYSGEIATV